MDHEHQEQGWLTPFGAAGLACAGARVLVPGHLDEELSAAQASELRAHLLACGACRRVLKQETSMRRWFQEGRPDRVAVPPDFAAHVARRAFQDDPGIDFSECDPSAEPVLATGVSLGSPEDHGPHSSQTPKRGALLSFLLASTAAAAVALFSFAVMLQRETLPQGDQLKALDYIPPWERGATQSSRSLGVPEAPSLLPVLISSELDSVSAPPSGEVQDDAPSAGQEPTDGPRGRPGDDH